jgi:hypothetical protein
VTGRGLQARSRRAEIIEAVEASGWRLDQMSYTPDRRGNPEGYYLFRRTG